MSCLTHPIGWRLYFSKYWNVNFFQTNKNLYPFSFHKTKLLFAAVSSVLHQLYFFNKYKNLLRFSTFRIFLNFNIVFILINYKFYWKAVYQDLKRNQMKQDLYKSFKIEYLLKKKKLLLNQNTLIHGFKSYLVKKRRGGRFFLMVGLPLVEDFYLTFYKKLIYFFFLLPLFLLFKEFISKVSKKIIPSKPLTKIFFFGLNQKNLNVFDLLNFVEYLLRKKSGTVHVFYSIMRALSFFKKKQNLKGFKFLLAGRFSRRDRATFLWKTSGSVSLGSRLSNIEFFTRPLILNYSKCVAKIWICRN